MWLRLLRRLFRLLGGDTVKVVVKRLEDHRLFETFLQANTLRYHTFFPCRVRPLSVFLRELHAHTDPQEILLDLHELGFPVQAIFRLHTNSNPRVPLPIVRLHLKKGKADDKVFHLTRLFGFRVKMEMSRPPGKLQQRHRCGCLSQCSGLLMRFYGTPDACLLYTSRCV